MGWTQYPDTTYTYQQAKAEIIRLCAPWTVVQISQVGSTWYVAHQRPDGHVTATVFLTNTTGGWCYKDMGEEMGPYEAKAPRSLIAKLTGPDKSGWRQNCLDHANRLKFKVGDKITLSSPANFQGHDPQTEFTKVVYRGTKTCWHNQAIGLCRLGPHALQGATLR